jgi:hypothetical protein
MDSDDDGFPKQGGEALEIGDEFDSEEEEADDMPATSADAMRKPMNANIAASSQATGAQLTGGDVKGAKVED